MKHVQKYETSKHAVKSSSTKTHSSILRLSLRQYVEQQTDITFTLFPVSLTFMEPMQRICHPAPFHSILLNLLPEPMHVCNPAHVWTLQRLAIWSTFWLHTTFLSFWNLCSASAIQLPMDLCNSFAIQPISFFRCKSKPSQIQLQISNPRFPLLLLTLSHTPTQNYTTVLLISQDTLQSLVVQDVQPTRPKVRKGNPPGSTTPNLSCSQTTKESATPNVGKWRWQSSSQRWSSPFHSQDWLADVPKLSHSFREICYGIAALSQKRKTVSQYDNNSRVPACLRVQCTFSASVPVFTTTSVPGFTRANCNNPSNVSHTWPACDPKQLCKFQTKIWKQTHNKSFLCRFKSHKTVSTSYTVQAVSNDSLHVPIKRNHNCSSKPQMLPDASENQNQHSQTVKQSSPWPFLLTVRCQPTTSTPSSPCLQCHDGSYFSLSQHSSA